KPRGEVILAATRGAKKSATKPPPIPAAAVAKATSSVQALPPLPIADPRAATLRATPTASPRDEFNDSSIRKTNVATSPFERGDPTTVQRDEEDATSIQRHS